MLAAGANTRMLEGTMELMTVILEFPSQETAERFYASPEYRAIIHLRHDSTANGSVICVDQFALPEGMAG